LHDQQRLDPAKVFCVNQVAAALQAVAQFCCGLPTAYEQQRLTLAKEYHDHLLLPDKVWLNFAVFAHSIRAAVADLGKGVP